MVIVVILVLILLLTYNQQQVYHNLLLKNHKLRFQAVDLRGAGQETESGTDSRGGREPRPSQSYTIARL